MKNVAIAAEVPDSSFSQLSDSLKGVCSFDDFKQRMGVYLSLPACKEIFHQINRVTKVLFSLPFIAINFASNLYIIFCGDSLVLNGDVDYDQDVVFLKMIIDKLFFSHQGCCAAEHVEADGGQVALGG